jgi:hypothetical protein
MDTTFSSPTGYNDRVAPFNSKNWQKQATSTALRCSLIVLLLCLPGCYEKVISTKTYPGWRVAGGASPPTAHDYSGVNMLPDRKKSFNPIGDYIIDPIGGVFESIGSAFTSKPKQPNRGNNGGNNTNNGANNNASQGPADAPPASSNNDPPAASTEGRSLFDTSPK